MKLEMKKDVIYRCIGTDFTNGILACGFMTKPHKEQSQYNFQIDYYSCFLLLSGTGYYYTQEDEKHSIHAGDYVQRLPGVCHSTEIVPDGSWLEFFISFGRTTYDYLCSLNLLPIEHPVGKSNYDESILQRFSRLLTQLKDAEDAALPLLSLQAQELLLTLLLPIQRTLENDPMRDLMEEACRILSSKISAAILPEDVAAQLNMSYENFRKQFHRFTGTSPAKYRIDQRMKHAKLMLLSGISIKETAMLTGYGDTYSFTKQFTNSVGMSPGRYRKEN
ncbi:MAG TPA: helix-turn-helix domain-containing protein [Mobilitalea sp.]|nr:helix-turn-helix domain-containing protein [Mobilitalea sp.]